MTVSEVDTETPTLDVEALASRLAAPLSPALPLRSVLSMARSIVSSSARASSSPESPASKVTVVIMSPPPCQGGISSSNDSLPYSTPMPVGPYILCPEKA